MNSFTKAGLNQYLDIAIDKGYISANTGNSWRAAVNKLLTDLNDDDDIENYDVRDAALRYNNKFPGDLTGSSLKKYEQRVKQAVKEFVSWKSDPMNYKRPGRLPVGGKTGELGKSIKRPRPITTPEVKRPLPSSGEVAVLSNAKPNSVGTIDDMSLPIPFPLRPGFVAQVVIPRNLTTAEAKRLSTFILALGNDVDPG